MTIMTSYLTFDMFSSHAFEIAENEIFFMCVDYDSVKCSSEYSSEHKFTLV